MTNMKLTTGFPPSYRWSAYVTTKSRKGGSKSDLFIFFYHAACGATHGIAVAIVSVCPFVCQMHVL